MLVCSHFRPRAGNVSIEYTAQRKFSIRTGSIPLGGGDDSASPFRTNRTGRSASAQHAAKHHQWLSGTRQNSNQRTGLPSQSNLSPRCCCNFWHPQSREKKIDRTHTRVVRAARVLRISPSAPCMSRHQFLHQLRMANTAAAGFWRRGGAAAGHNHHRHLRGEPKTVWGLPDTYCRSHPTHPTSHAVRALPSMYAEVTGSGVVVFAFPFAALSRLLFPASWGINRQACLCVLHHTLSPHARTVRQALFVCPCSLQLNRRTRTFIYPSHSRYEHPYHIGAGRFCHGCFYHHTSAGPRLLAYYLPLQRVNLRK